LDWPDSYSEVEKAVEEIADEESQNEPYIARTALYQIFQKKGIDDTGFDYLADYMSELGIITQFPGCQDLNDFIVIKPQWLTKAISLVLEDDEVANNQGEVSHKNLGDLWKEKYPGMYPFFHD